MNRLFKITASLCLSLALVVLLSITPEKQVQANNGTDVVMFKNVGWSLNTACGSFPELSSSTQFKDGELHLLRINFDVSGSCLVPEKGTNKSTVASPYGTAEVIYTSSGMAIVKLVVND